MRGAVWTRQGSCVRSQARGRPLELWQGDEELEEENLGPGG